MTTTKNIRINVEAYDKLDAAIKAAEGKHVTVRRICAGDVQRMVREIEETLHTRLYKKDWAGLRFSCDDNAQSFPGAYKGRPESTHFELERTASGWFVTRIMRNDCRSPKNRIICHNMKDKAEALVSFAIENW